MRALVTGASGFIGSHLVDRLIDDGDEVRTLVRPGSSSARDGVQSSLIDWRAPDVRQIDAVLDGVNVVFHLAGVTRAHSAARFREGNVAPLEALASGVRRIAAARRPHLILVSSQAASGPATTRSIPVDEEWEPLPVEGYGRSKREAERVAQALGADAPVTVVRPSCVYGPRDRDFFQLFRLARWGWSIHPGERERWIDLVHVEDLVRGLLAAAREPQAIGRTYFLGDRALTWRDLHEGIGQAVGVHARAVDIPDRLVQLAGMVGSGWGAVRGRTPLMNAHKAALGRERYWLCSSERARRELGYAPNISLPQGLRQTYLWYLAQGWLRPTGGDEHHSRLRHDSQERFTRR